MNKMCLSALFSTGLIFSALHLAPPTAQAQVLADSIAEFSGTQGENGWFNGYRNYTFTGETENYDPEADFTPYPGGEGEGDWDGFTQTWTGEAWDLNTAAAGPWTFQGPEGIHPNGLNSDPFEEHWAIRRWVASEINADTLVRIIWRVRKENTGGGDGVTGGIWINGNRVASATIPGNDGTGVTRTNYLTLEPGDRVDLVLTPAGTSEDRNDGSDGSFTSMVIEAVSDSDDDDLPDPWEELYSPGDLTRLNGAGDPDEDDLTNLEELERGTNPLLADTDNDGLADGVETNTGSFISPTDTGTDPLNPDIDRDGRLDGEEVNGTPASDPFAQDTDGDMFPDGFEASTGHDPSDPEENPNTDALARSFEEFSGTQGENNWFFGYRNTTTDGGGKDYDPEEAFVEFTPEEFTGSQWDLNTAAAAPWTELGPENTHPNGSNNGNIHWTIRRWIAESVTQTTPLALHWQVRKTNPGCGNGVTGALHINGREVDLVVLPLDDTVGQWRTWYANIEPGDIIDLVLRPTGTDGSDADGCDGSANRLIIDTVIPATPRQPDGTLFIPAGAGDSDNDGIPDIWERIYFPDDLTRLSQTGDADSDGLNDLAEYQRDSDPTVADTDNDGLPDLVETGTGNFVSATDTGSSPRSADTDEDGLSDRDEVQGNPPTNPNRVDSDGDTFSDPDELAEGTDPNDPEDNVLAMVIANSIAEFSGVQGTNGWFNGYRNYTLTGATENYDPEADFIPYPGGEGEGEWDGEFQTWTGTAWDLNTAAAGPWTFQNPQSIHPNGENSPPNEEHWAIRRWVADEITETTPVAVIWRVIKENPAGDGVTGALYLNGERLDSVTIGGNNTTNPVRRFYINLEPGDIIDLALTPEGLTDRSDGSDGSVTWFWVDRRIPPDPRQPDGTPFVPAGQPQGIRFESAAYDPVQNRITLTWPSTAGATYTVEASEDLRTWTVVGANVPSAGDRTTYSEAVEANRPHRFYRLRQ